MGFQEAGLGTWAHSGRGRSTWHVPGPVSGPMTAAERTEGRAEGGEAGRSQAGLAVEAFHSRPPNEGFGFSYRE